MDVDVRCKAVGAVITALSGEGGTDVDEELDIGIAEVRNKTVRRCFSKSENLFNLRARVELDQKVMMCLRGSASLLAVRVGTAIHILAATPSVVGVVLLKSEQQRQVSVLRETRST
jgi:hypothetical protein